VSDGDLEEESSAGKTGGDNASEFYGVRRSWGLVRVGSRGLVRVGSRGQVRVGSRGQVRVGSRVFFKPSTVCI